MKYCTKRGDTLRGLEVAEGEDRVQAAEGEGVGEGDFLLGLAGGVEDYV